MGQLIEQTIKTLFNGVSRQPHSVRLPSQVESADNAMFSVVTSGFEKRPPTTHIGVIAGLDTTTDYAIHTIDRDDVEKYLVVLGGNTLRVYDALTGAAKTVYASSADAISYLTGSPYDFRMVSVADYTFILNTKRKIVMGPAGTGTLKGTAQNFNKLPTTGQTSGDIWHVTGDENTSFDDYYVRWNGSVWVQAADPAGHNDIDATSMPYQMVRNSDGTFTISKATWASRLVGDEISVEAPKFVDKYPTDIFFHRGRLGISSDEGATLSQAADVFNFWPDKATDMLDSDPIEVQASSSKITIIRHSVPFRKSLFVTSDSMQFEVGPEDKMTPKTATITPTTSYQIDPMCKPVGMGDQLYFVSKSQGSSIIYEYYYDGDSYSNTAADVTKHCLGYVPAGVRMMAASTITQRLFVMPNTNRNYLYVYSSYWTGKEKAQSAWGRYVLGSTESEAYLLSMSVMADKVYMVLRRGTQVVLETMPVDSLPDDTGLGFSVLLDRRVSVTGVFNAGTNRTTWTLPYNHLNNVVVVKDGSSTKAAGGTPAVTYPTANTVQAIGDHSGSPVVAGMPYTLRVELSRQYPRDANQQITPTGRCQMRRVSFQYKKTGYFEVHVTPEGRATKVWKMTGRLIGSSKNVIGRPSVEDAGLYTAKVMTRADTVKIEVVNSTPYPTTITGASWDGFYNNIVKQG